MSYDPRKRNGWARGLIHFHTRFSDGWASVLRAGEIAREAGYDFLIITDHLRNLKLFTHRTLDECVRACDDASRALGFPVIPGGEMEVRWDDPVTTDFSQAHTLAFSIRDLAAAGEYDWTTPGTDPFAQWTDSQGGRGTILALQEKLRAYSLPPAASHQFQHSALGARPGQQPDYRYDLLRLDTSRYLDFFSSGAVELIHEAEDILLVADHATTDPGRMKGVYASCDFHVGPQTTRPPLAKLLHRIAFLGRAYRRVFTCGAAMVVRLTGGAELAASPGLPTSSSLTRPTSPWATSLAPSTRCWRRCARDGRTSHGWRPSSPGLTRSLAPPVSSRPRSAST